MDCGGCVMVVRPSEACCPEPYPAEGLVRFGCIGGEAGSLPHKNHLTPCPPDPTNLNLSPVCCCNMAYAARMANSDYTKDDLSRDLFLMVQAGLLEVRMREDGEWVYHPSEAALAMSDEEKADIISRLDEFDID